jgi:hypothetical protein
LPTVSHQKTERLEGLLRMETADFFGGHTAIVPDRLR